MNIHEWHGLDTPPHIIQQTVEWIAVLDDLDSSPQNVSKLSEFYTWLDEDPIHQSSFAELSELWAKTACLNTFRSMVETSQVLAFPGQRSKRTTNDSFDLPPLISDPLMGSTTFSPGWLYGVTLFTICIGFFIPHIA